MHNDSELRRGGLRAGIIPSASLACVLVAGVPVARAASGAESVGPASLWTHDHVFANGVEPDSKSRTPQQSAQMLEDLGIRQLNYGVETKDLVTLDERIEAFKRHGIRILAWEFPYVDDSAPRFDWETYKIQDGPVLVGQGKPADHALTVRELLQVFRRHHIAPQLWLQRPMRERATGAHSACTPSPPKDFSEFTDEEKNRCFRAQLGYDLTTTPQERRQRIAHEADRIKALAQLTQPYGVTVALYKHGGWLGIAENQVAVMKRLKAQGVNNVGIIYQFIHAHDEVDDTVRFASVWKAMQPDVLAVNVTGVHAGRRTIFPILYPSQGALEGKMMKVIQDSGWQGPIGLCPEKGGDAEVNLRNNLIGLDWLAAELKQPGSGGPRPFPAE